MARRWRRRAAKGAMRNREGNDRRRLSVVDDSRDFMIRYIEGESEKEGGEPITSRSGMRRGKPRCARGIIIHPAYYPYTGTIDEPTPNAPPACTYFGLYASKMNSVIRRGQRVNGWSVARSVGRLLQPALQPAHSIPTPRPFKHGTAESLGLIIISARQATVAIVVSEVMVVLLRTVPLPATRYTVSVHRAGQRTGMHMHRVPRLSAMEMQCNLMRDV
ncbi:hypothetical protein ALC62_15826 [Cyphomyrmex costatus]|uniref:Uncharacterized protein n=1 Tax=Cyphomyrmex costatus TaxID=456900 RepID=A0A195BZY3_9HYME|nr:hypothetical protein ALC62_15826 [Cyphomyrmex costatus]